MTFANDHRVSIVGPDQDDVAKKQRSTQAGSEMGADHTRMLIALKRHMRKIALSQNKCVDERRVLAWANEFSAMYANPDAIATRLALLQPLSCCLLDRQHSICRPKVDASETAEDDAVRKQQKKDDSDTSSSSSESVETMDVESTERVMLIATNALSSAPNVTWFELVCAICYERIESDKREKVLEEEEGMAFLATHGESAPFLAAAAMSPQNAMDFLEHPGDQSEGELRFKAGQARRSSLAFMRQFPDLMNEWYDYNSHTREPIFGLEHVPRNCRCLPRHIDTCPHPVATFNSVTATTATVTAAAKAETSLEFPSTRQPRLSRK